MINIFDLYFNFFDDLNIHLKLTIQICFTILLAFLVTRLVKYILFLLFKYFSTSKSIFDNSLIVALKKPIIFFIWLYCFIFCTNLLIAKVDESLIQITRNFKFISVYMLILVFLMRSITQIKRHYIMQKERRGVVPDYAGIDTLEKLSKVSVFIIWSIFALGSIGLNLNALLAFGGAGGIFVGFAGRDLLANIFGGLMIYMDKPFAVGDWISSPDREIEGDVEDIGWRQTRILSLEKFPIYVPNSIFGTIVVQNRSRLRSRRLREMLNIRYLDFDKIDKITSEIMTFLKENPGVNKKYKLFANFTNFTNGLITLTVQAFTTTTELVRFQEVRQEILLKVIQIIKDNGAEVAFNTSTVYMNDGNVLDKHSSLIDEVGTI
jgi:MscS family membrane protein